MCYVFSRIFCGTILLMIRILKVIIFRTKYDNLSIHLFTTECRPWSFNCYFYQCFSFIYFLDLESKWIFYSLIFLFPPHPVRRDFFFVIQLA